MTDAHADGWSLVAPVWAELWGGFSAPARSRLLDVADVGPGCAVLDVGCGSGELLADAIAREARAVGVDPAPAMVALARRRAPEADVREASWLALPWPDASFDVVTAVNALQFAEDPDDALGEAVRVVRPGGRIAIANWAERALNDLDVIDAALAEAAGDEPHGDGDLREPGGLSAALADAGLTRIEEGIVSVPWTADDDESLVRGVLLGEDPGAAASERDVVLDAARRFRGESGAYVLQNSFRYAVGWAPR